MRRSGFSGLLFGSAYDFDPKNQTKTMNKEHLYHIKIEQPHKFVKTKRGYVSMFIHMYLIKVLFPAASMRFAELKRILREWENAHHNLELLYLNRLCQNLLFALIQILLLPRQYSVPWSCPRGGNKQKVIHSHNQMESSTGFIMIFAIFIFISGDELTLM